VGDPAGAAIAPPVANTGLRSYAGVMARILALDDNQTILAFLGDLLGREHEVVTTTEWTEANRLLHQGGFDLVLVDEHLEHFRGSYFVRAIRSFFGPELPVVVLSGDDARDEAVAAGATAFFLKGALGELQAYVNGVLGCPSCAGCTLRAASGEEGVECLHCAGGVHASGERLERPCT